MDPRADRHGQGEGEARHDDHRPRRAELGYLPQRREDARRLGAAHHIDDRGVERIGHSCGHQDGQGHHDAGAARRQPRSSGTDPRAHGR
jgi:hypothetical protein